MVYGVVVCRGSRQDHSYREACFEVMARPGAGCHVSMYHNGTDSLYFLAKLSGEEHFKAFAKKCPSVIRRAQIAIEDCPVPALASLSLASGSGVQQLVIGS